MEDRDWLILQTLFDQKNITKTAHALFISQPALTARLRQIEKEFDLQIVHRTSKGVHFTPQGEFLAKRATEMLREIRKVKEQVKNLDTRVSGTLRIGASGYFTMFILPPLLRDFKQLYPEVEFKLNTTWSKDVFSLVYNQEVHVGFVSSDYGWPNEKHLLFEEPIFIASTNEIQLQDLPKLPRIDYHTDQLIKAMIDKWWRETFTEPPSISMEVDKLATCKEMVKNGLGYGILPSFILKGETNLHTIMIKDKHDQPLLRKTWMLYHQDALEMNVVKALVNFVKQSSFK